MLAAMRRAFSCTFRVALQDGRAADGDAPAAAGAVAHLHRRGVAVADDDLVEVDAEVVGDDLRERRLVPLAVGRGARVGGDRARRLHPHHRALVGAEAAHLHVARPGRCRAACGRCAAGAPSARGAACSIAGQPERLGQAPGRTRRSRSSGRSASRRGRRSAGMKFFRRTSSGGLPELGGHDVDQPLQVVGGLRPAGPAIRRDRRRVGEDARGLQIDVGELVDADAHGQREVGDEGEDRIGADVRRHLHAQRGDGAVVLHRGLEVGDLGPPVRGGHHVLDARLDPLERHAVVRARGRPAPRPRGSSRTCCRSRRPCPG